MIKLQTNDVKIPYTWKNVRLKEIAIINPQRPKNLNYGDDNLTTFVPMPAVCAAKGAIENPLTVPFKKVKKGYTFFMEGDVLFAKITPCMQNGKHAIAENLINGIGFGTTEFHVIRPLNNVLAMWVHSFIRQEKVLSKATESFTGAVGQQRVPKDFLENLIIPLPPLPEQKRIVEILHKQLELVEKAKKSAEEKLQAVKKLRESLLNNVFRQMEILPTGWKYVTLGDVCEMMTGGTPNSSIREYYDNGNIKWLVSGDIHQKEIFDCPNRITEKGLNNSNAKYLPVNSVLIALNGQGKTRGTVALLRTEAACNQSLLAMYPIDKEKLVSEYLYYVLTSIYQQIRNITGDNHRSGLSITIVKQIKLALPPLAEQKQIVEKLSKQLDAADKVLKQCEEELEAINKLPASLLQKAFEGD
ncbi:MAG: hypothetical protein A2Y10_15345 [Planctomycetes bacterium GWF2_41_51]|nr:MAG: hypothetical protein A2Y10_15345 [Planctomycetes bacterium GWF2_41_51]HBG26976.1 hypothetical protein [Phycisphaerales bacterium]